MPFDKIKRFLHIESPLTPQPKYHETFRRDFDIIKSYFFFADGKKPMNLHEVIIGM